ncbi:hypothetical protein K438DRAFT_1751206 [Mycena galopus ATCC 62051]|nr:hypothetical protein K438DRAFT_1751206 [Mycena galopus ATCC 62051]
MHIRDECEEKWHIPRVNVAPSAFSGLGDPNGCGRSADRELVPVFSLERQWAAPRSRFQTPLRKRDYISISSSIEVLCTIEKIIERGCEFSSALGPGLQRRSAESNRFKTKQAGYYFMQGSIQRRVTTFLEPESEDKYILLEFSAEPPDDCRIAEVQPHNVCTVKRFSWRGNKKITFNQ